MIVAVSGIADAESVSWMYLSWCLSSHVDQRSGVECCAAAVTSSERVLSDKAP